MTTSIQTSAFHSQNLCKRRRTNSYLVIVNGEDGNYKEFEVEAVSQAEANSKAEAIAHRCMIDVTFVEIYEIAE